MNLFIFHRDLRVSDNIALDALCKNSREIYFCFIFNEKQLAQKNPYFGNPSFQTMLRILEILQKKIIINFFEGESELLVIKEINKKHGPIKQIFWNEDVTPFAQERTKELIEYCKKSNIKYLVSQDLLLFKPGNILNSQRKHYQVFTPFWHRLITLKNEINPPKGKPEFRSLKMKPIKYQIKLEKHIIKNFPILWKTTRRIFFKQLFEDIKNYDDKRNNLEAKLSLLSVALKFGLVSIREVIWLASHSFSNFENSFNRQIAWREFYYHFYILNSSKNDFIFGKNIRSKYDNFWNNFNSEYFEKWKSGQTGYSLVDAGIHQLLKTGFMHNRTRMITASFLTKNLLIHWKYGEHFFAQKLIDYDPIINQANWQWVAGCGVDAQPFWRIFNPYTQAKRFDKNGVYQKKWLPKHYQNLPVVDWKESYQLAKIEYSKLEKNS